MIFSFLVYCSLVVVLFILGKKYQATNKIYYLLLLFTAYSFVLGIRYGVGVDHLRYYELYENWGDLRDSLWLRYEIGFVFFNNLFYSLKVPTPLYFAAISFIQIFLYFIRFRQSSFLIPYMAFVFIFSCAGITGCTNGIRQYMGAYLFMFIFPFLSERKAIPYFVGALLAFSLHKSLIILFPIFFIAYIDDKIVENRNAFSISLFLFISAIFVRLAFGNVMLPFFNNFQILDDLDYETYLASMRMKTDSSIGIFRFFRFVLNILVLSSIPDLCKSYKKEIRFINKMFMVWILGTFLYYLFEGSLLMERLLIPFRIMDVPVYSLYLYHMFKNNILHFSFALTIILIIFVNTVSHGASNTSRYVSVFQETELYRKQIEVSNFK